MDTTAGKGEMNTETFKSDTILLTTAVIWGFAFVAQRVGMEYIGPFLFNGIRFALGCCVLLPLVVGKNGGNHKPRTGEEAGRVTLFIGSAAAGLMLFAGASLQQVGLVYTTAGKAGFITGLYVIIVPLLALFWGQRTTVGTWVGAVLAAAGLYFLSISQQFTIAFGDVLVLLCALFFAAHVLIIGWLSPKMNSFRLAFIQYGACSLLSLIVAVLYEPITRDGILRAAVPLLYGGVMSVGIAYTLQVIGQRRAHPAHAAIILSLESVFAALGGWALLGETMSSRQMSGCGLMLFGMLVSQLWIFIVARKLPAEKHPPPRVSVLPGDAGFHCRSNIDDETG
jgi:drug/metabolite transporter (DMT)-like permease